MSYPPVYPPAEAPQPAPQPAPRTHRRRWPWVTGAVVALVFALAGLLGQHPQPAPVPVAGLINATSTTPTTSTETTTTAPATTTTTVPPVTTTVAPPPVTRAVVPATHRTSTHPVVPATHRTTTHQAPAPPATQPAAGGKYHAGEFCSTVGATAISSTGAPMTCLQEGKYQRWHND